MKPTKNRSSARPKHASVLGLGASVEIVDARGDEPELVLHRAMLDTVADLDFPYPTNRFAGRGIVICGGGAKYFPSVYVLLRLLRSLGCKLPVEVWHLGEEEMTASMRNLVEGLGAITVDGLAMRRVHPARRLGGWELKCYAILHCAFSEVLLLDADNCPVRDPSFLFDTAEYAATAAIFWPDYTRFRRGQAVWLASGISYRDEPEFESGQIVVDKARCWRALNVAMHLNEHSEWWYRVVHGDKDTFHLAWRKIGQPYAMPPHPTGALEATMLQYDFDGNLLFQHRNFAKWSLEANREIRGFRLEKRCFRFVADLRKQWAPGMPKGVRKWDCTSADDQLHAIAEELCGEEWIYERLGVGSRRMTFSREGTIIRGKAGCEQWWSLENESRARSDSNANCRLQPEFEEQHKQDFHGREERGAFVLIVAGRGGVTFRARLGADGNWRGEWVNFERCQVSLKKLNAEDCHPETRREESDRVDTREMKAS